METVRAKIAYAKQKGLLGYNVFQVGNDDNWELSRAGRLQFTTWSKSIWSISFHFGRL